MQLECPPLPPEALSLHAQARKADGAAAGAQGGISPTGNKPDHPMLRGWVNYFVLGNFSESFSYIAKSLNQRLAHEPCGMPRRLSRASKSSRLMLWRLWRCGQRASVVQSKLLRRSSVRSTAGSPTAPVTPSRQTAIGVRFGLMWAQIVVKGEPSGNTSPGLVPVGIAFQVDIFVLDRSPQALDASVHRDVDPCRGRVPVKSALVIWLP